MANQNKENEMKAKYAGKCRDCGGNIQAGEQIMWSRDRGARHPNCQKERTQNNDQAEYDRGKADYSRWKFNTETFGEEYAAAEEMAWELKDPDPYY